jgi:hypothetical protein
MVTRIGSFIPSMLKSGIKAKTNDKNHPRHPQKAKRLMLQSTTTVYSFWYIPKNILSHRE